MNTALQAILENNLAAVRTFEGSSVLVVDGQSHPCSLLIIRSESEALPEGNGQGFAGTIHVSTAAMKRMPRPPELVSVDGREYRIISVEVAGTTATLYLGVS